ncbi:MAG: SprB repeat-containing protein, partial [Nonlabens sp.]|uniref:SprB repeat-containing protein n=1 Tax=Nonlabens sp. TaxID=1888209 RepID=UPI0035A57B77
MKKITFFKLTTFLDKLCILIFEIFYSKVCCFHKKNNVSFSLNKVSIVQYSNTTFGTTQLSSNILSTQSHNRTGKFLIVVFILLGTLFSYGQCPNTYVFNIATKTIKFNFDAGNAADDRNVACDFVRVHGGTGADPCSGGFINVAGIVYSYTSSTAGAFGSNSPITLTYTTTATLTTAPTDFEIAKGIGCGKSSNNGCFTILFQDKKTGNNCSSSNSDFSITINDVGNCGPYTLLTTGNSALDFPSSVTTGTYSTTTIKAGVYILLFKDKFLNEHSIIYNHITQDGTCIRQSNLDIVKTITSGSIYNTVGNIVNYTYTVTSDSNITGPITVTDDKINIVSYFSGDTNSDNILQTTETWIYKASYAIVQEDINRTFVKNIAFARGLDQYGVPIFSEVSEATATLASCNFFISNISSTNIKCNGVNDGKVTATKTGGVGTITYDLLFSTTLNGTYTSTSLPTNGDANGIYTGLGVGFYKVVVSEANGCSDTSSAVEITQPAAIAVATSTKTDASCN